MATYIVRAGTDGPVKIGRADDVEARVADLQTANYERLCILRIIDTPFDAEPIFHERFKHLRVLGEWFKFDPEMMTFLPDEPRSVEFDPGAGFGPSLVKIGARKVARDLNTNDRTIRNWIEGKSTPSFAHIVAMLNHEVYAPIVLTALGRPDLANPAETIEREISALESDIARFRDKRNALQ